MTFPFLDNLAVVEVTPNKKGYYLDEIAKYLTVSQMQDYAMHRNENAVIALIMGRIVVSCEDFQRYISGIVYWSQLYETPAARTANR